MKHCIIILGLLLPQLTTQAQSLQAFFDKNDEREVVWLGIDFSHVQLIGEFAHFSGAGTQSANDMTYKYFPGWNSLVLNEPGKYDVLGMVRKYRIDKDIETITDVNRKTDTDKLRVGFGKEYSSEEVVGFVSSYDFEQKDAYGFLFLVESMNKTDEEAFIHFVVLDLKSKKVLLTSRLRGKPQGFGLKNYWGGAIYDVIKTIRDQEYSRWAKKYGK